MAAEGKGDIRCIPEEPAEKTEVQKLSSQGGNWVGGGSLRSKSSKPFLSQLDMKSPKQLFSVTMMATRGSGWRR